MASLPAPCETTCTRCPVLRSKNEALGPRVRKRVARVIQYCRMVLFVWQRKSMETVSTAMILPT